MNQHDVWFVAAIPLIFLIHCTDSWGFLANALRLVLLPVSYLSVMCLVYAGYFENVEPMGALVFVVVVVLGFVAVAVLPMLTEVVAVLIQVNGHGY